MFIRHNVSVGYLLKFKYINALLGLCLHRRRSFSTISSKALPTRSSAIAEGPRDASCQLKSCQLPRNSAETTCTTSPEPSISCFVCLVQYTEVDAQCDKLANVVGRTSTVASAVNLVRPTTVVSLSHWASTFVQLEACSLHMN